MREKKEVQHEKRTSFYFPTAMDGWTVNVVLCKGGVQNNRTLGSPSVNTGLSAGSTGEAHPVMPQVLSF